MEGLRMKIRYKMSGGISGTITGVEPGEDADETAALHEIAARNGQTAAVTVEYGRFCHCPGEVIDERGGLTADDRCPICGEQWA
jgi:hypothetical protein